MRRLAIIIPEKIPSTLPKGVQRAFKSLQRLPDDYLVYYESLINPHRPDFIIINPEFGLMVVEIRSWYPGHIRAVTEDDIHIQDDNPRNEMHPLVHARQYLKSVLHRSSEYSLCSPLLTTDGNDEEFRFPTGVILLLPNCTIPQLKRHRLGNLLAAFGSEITICRDMLKELETWDMAELIPFLKSYMHPSGGHLPLTGDFMHIIRAVVHPDIIIQPGPDDITQKQKQGTSLKILDYTQEKRLYAVTQGHSIFFGPAGSGKTAFMIARIRFVHHYHEEYQILVLCFSDYLCDILQKTFANYQRIDVYTFRQWAELQGISGKPSENAESDQEYGLRMYRKIMDRGRKFLTYDAIFIDEGNEFSPSWFQCAREALKDPDHGDLFIVADGQKGFQGLGGVRWKDIGIHIRGHITKQGLIIEKHYENTREILNLSLLFLLPVIEENEEEYKNLLFACESGSRSGLKPLLVWNTSHQHQADYAVFLVQRILGSIKSAHHLSGIRPDDIAILYPYAEGRDKNIMRILLENLGQFFPVQWVSEELTTYNRVHLPGLKIHDCHSVKGLHYRVVMIVFAENFERYFDDPNFFSDRNLFYNALIRPLDFLSIQYTCRTAIIRKIIASGYVDEFNGK